VEAVIGTGSQQLQQLQQLAAAEAEQGAVAQIEAEAAVLLVDACCAFWPSTVNPLRSLTAWLQQQEPSFRMG